jgi:hypothetical protein
LHSQKNSEHIKIYILLFVVFLVIVNLPNDKNEHIDEVALSNMATMINNGNITATDLTVTGTIKLQNADGTVVLLNNGGKKNCKIDGRITANNSNIGGLYIGATKTGKHGISILENPGGAWVVDTDTYILNDDAGIGITSNGITSNINLDVNGKLEVTGNVKVKGDGISDGTLETTKNANISGVYIGAARWGGHSISILEGPGGTWVVNKTNFVPNDAGVNIR